MPIKIIKKINERLHVKNTVRFWLNTHKSVYNYCQWWERYNEGGRGGGGLVKIVKNSKTAWKQEWFKLIIIKMIVKNTSQNDNYSNSDNTNNLTFVYLSCVK